MTYLVWPFSGFTDNTWKTSFLERSSFSALPSWEMTFYQDAFTGYFDSWNLLTDQTYDWPPFSFLKESQFRLSSNFNSRMCRRPTDQESEFQLYDVIMASSGTRPKKLKSCPVPRFKEHEYQSTGKFRVQRRWSTKDHKYIEEQVPIMVRKIKLLPGAKKGSLLPNALWFEEHQRSCSSPGVYFYYPYTFGEVKIGSEFHTSHIYVGPWNATTSGLYSGLLGEMGNEFTSECLSDPLILKYAPEIALVDNKAIRKLHSKIVNQKVDLATALAEGAKSIDMFKNIFSRLLDFILAIAKLKKGEIKTKSWKAIKDLLPLSPEKMSNDFLAYRYGISPLISDISGAAEALAAYFDDMSPVEARGRSRSIIDSSSNAAESVGNGFNRYKYISKVTIDVVYKISYTVPDLGMKRLDELGFTNPANVEWELVPFSFVIDWFLPIGNFIRDLGSLDRLVVKECTRTVSVRSEQGRVYMHDTGVLPNGIKIDGGIWDWQVTDFMVVREIIPVPPQLPLPRFKNPFSVGHIANGIALLVQLIKR